MDGEPSIARSGTPPEDDPLLGKEETVELDPMVEDMYCDRLTTFSLL
jgi:hypothetical protein